MCKVEAAKSDVTQLLTKKMYHAEDRIKQDDMDGYEPIELNNTMSLREKVATIYRQRLIEQAEKDGRIAPNKDNTAAYEVLGQQAQDYAEELYSTEK